MNYLKTAYARHWKYRHLKVEANCQSKWYGNQYGGFYAVPKLLKAGSVVYSVGIGEDISFDEAVLKNHRCHVFGFDPTPKSILWCKQSNLPANFHFHPFGLAEKSGKVNFHLPKNSNHVSGSMLTHHEVSKHDVVEVEMRSFADMASSLGHSKVDLLKMDIEGAEYGVIAPILAAGIEIPQLAIEFHGRFFKDGKAKDRQAVQQLKANGYLIAAVSDTFQEVTFVKKSALTGW